VLLEESDDSFAPGYQPRANTRGGTSIIKAQSLCPFRAFAEFRLRATSLEEGCLGLDSRERGGNLHQALEFVWQKLRTRDRLRATRQSELEELVESAAEEAVTRSQTSLFSEIVASVEIERLRTVILDWMAVERERQQNFTVETVEQERYFDLAGLRLRLRLDRLDRLCGGELLLIDYKSGELTARKLEGDRPEEPQLFVYASSLEEDVAGLFFGQLKAREARLKGISRTRQIAGNGNQVRKDWDVFLLEGKRKVYRLAEQFRDGYAAVDPLKGACDYCAQKAFCRVYEARREEEAEG
jgi:ATP-dependent helicase/DNAse subunit B